MQKFYTQIEKIPYKDALDYYKRLRTENPAFIFESSDATNRSSRLSIVGVEPILELKAQGDICEVKCLQERGELFYNHLIKNFKSDIQAQNENDCVFFMPKSDFRGDENQRFTRKNTGQLIRSLLTDFKINDKNYFGLYGALAYNFIYLYEDIEQHKESSTPDFHLFLFDNVLFFNHLTESCSIYCSRTEKLEAESYALYLLEQIAYNPPPNNQQPTISNIKVEPTDEVFMNQVDLAREFCENGDLMELVLCRKISADITGDTLPLYESYREVNPSPYMFHFNFGDEILLGASPEVMVRYENGKVILRPISGSAAIGENVLETHNNMINLLTDPKEKSELDMLIDLGRNDLSKVCKPGVEIEQYRVIEKYSHVMHTVAQVAGELEEDKIGFDALIACLNAGTLTGAPKVMAMQKIEEIEAHSRGYYGGCIGYFLLNGDVNTGIVIRTAHIKDEKLDYCSGATLLYESVPENELKETNIKSGAFIKMVNKFKESETKKEATVPNTI